MVKEEDWIENCTPNNTTDDRGERIKLQLMENMDFLQDILFFPLDSTQITLHATV